MTPNAYRTMYEDGDVKVELGLVNKLPPSPQREEAEAIGYYYIPLYTEAQLRDAFNAQSTATNDLDRVKDFLVWKRMQP